MNAINEKFANFRTACDEAPAGTYEAEKQLRAAIGEAVDGLRALAQTFGLHPNNCDDAHNVEATIYHWLTVESIFGAAAEGFGKAMHGPARERVLAQTIRDRDFLKSQIPVSA